ncbi:MULTISPECIES: hypothetical protein [Helicobacter]|uniref:Uncharacterized protein n=1 Tax=Helicobacter macacae MIT 99-5501 TaxID=1357400 RepID=V8C663_9HELI|nr:MULTISPECIES: hypothetical protein [Helicobacter]ETD22903.1 hypothetical protein HMPREF2086_01702 [Helicobacter macacae MIT 99-5501]RDU55403.1 hypothetical protein CQA40_01120 [Helicobacter sp. MIT 01-3238]
MGLIHSLVSPFFSKVFISINVDALSCAIKVVRVKKGRTIESFVREFKTGENKIPMDAVKIVRKYRRKYPFTYISVLLKSLAQGVVIQKNGKDFFLANVRPQECEIITVGTCRVFAKKALLRDYLRKYDIVNGVDFVFSPFLLIAANSLSYPTLGNNLYVLLQRSNIALMVINRQQILFSGFFLAQSEISALNREEQQRPTLHLRNFEDFSLDDDFDNFEKMESETSMENLQTDMFIPNLEEKKINYDDMPRAIVISKVLLDGIKEYYQNPFYNGEFIDRIIFLDACKLSDEAYDFITKEVMIESVKRDFDLPTLLVNFAIRELGREE